MKKLYKDSKTFVDKPVKLPRSEVNQNFLKLIAVSCEPLNTEAIKGLSWKSLLLYPLISVWPDWENFERSWQQISWVN